MNRVFSYLKPYWFLAVIGPLFKLVEAVLELMLPMMMRTLINDGIATKNLEMVYSMGFKMLIVSILGLLAAWVCQYSGSRAGQSYATDLRNGLFAHINTLSRAEVKQLGVPTLLTRITNDTNQLQTLVAMGIRLIVRAPFIVIGSFVMCAYLDWRLSMILLIATPIFVLLLMFVLRKTLPLSQTVQARLDRLGIVLSENLSGVRVIRAFARQKEEEDRFEDANQNHATLASRLGTIASLANPGTMFIMNMAIAAIIWFGGVRVNSGAIMTGTIVTFVNYMIELISTLVVTMDLIIVITKGMASKKRVQEIFDINSTIVSGAQTLTIGSGDVNQKPLIVFKNVNFHYFDTADNTLENINFSANMGETIGIIGGTGSGKSTLVNLIPRLYDATDGSIQIHDSDIREYNLNSLWDEIAFVPQKSLLMSGSIRDNMHWGKQDATDDEIWEAIHTAQANFIQEKDGLDTHVDRGGVNFSGGQRQRLSIARALVRKPRILILDDSSSALDFATDYALRSALQTYSQNMTVFIVSQRVSSVMFADKILMMDDGEIIGQGTHDELMNTCDLYHEIVSMQIEDAEVE